MLHSTRSAPGARRLRTSRRPATTRALALSWALVLSPFGCTGDAGNQGDETGSGASALEVRFAPPGANAPSSTLAPGGTLDAPLEQRDAVLVMLRGELRTGPKPYQAEILRVLDAPVHVDIDVEGGPDHWITRAEVLDAQGDVLWVERINSLFQLLEYLKLVLAQTSTVNLSVTQAFQLVRAQYPSLLEFGVRVPRALEGAQTLRLSVRNPDGIWEEVASFEMADVLGRMEPLEARGEVTTIVEHGPPQDRIDVVLLGDGYAANERAKFELDAQAVAERLMSTSPMREHAFLFNVRAVWTPSAESGAGYDCEGAPGGCEDRLRDTEYGTVFVINAIIDRLNLNIGEVSDRVALPLNVAKLFENGALAGYDELLLISNTRRFSGFAGLYASVVTTYDDRRDFPETAVHEFGHSFGVLGDEYEVPGDPCLANEPRIPLPENIAQQTPLMDFKWFRWMREDTPVPTPPNLADRYPVGAFKGAYNCAGLMRPSVTCMMRDSGKPFCAVCAEQLVRRMYHATDITEHRPTALSWKSNTLSIALPLRAELPTKVQWTLGESYAGQDATGVFSLRELRRAGADQDWVAIEGRLQERSTLVRQEDPRLAESLRVWVRLAKGP